MNRLEQIKNHLYNDLIEQSDNIFGTVFGDKVINLENINRNKFLKLEDRSDRLLFELIDGPINAGVSKIDAYLRYKEMEEKGLNNIELQHMQDNYGTEADYSNLIIPWIIEETENKLESNSTILYGNNNSYIGQLVILCHPEDCINIAKRHIKKQPNFTPILMDSIISTTDNDHWREQRDHYTQAFLPNASLKKVFHTTLKRAIECSNKLKLMINDSNLIDMSEFLLHEANAQLNLTMFGSDKMYNEENNIIIRKALKGKAEKGVLKNYISDLIKNLEESNDINNDPWSCSDNSIHGPLGRAISEHNVDKITKWGNGLIFSFAGHDTTGHSMTFFCLEMAKNKNYENKIIEEIDNFFKEKDNLEYDDLKYFPFLTRCWTEILRLWPAVPNGTYRQLQYDDYIVGKNGEDVQLPKGTYVLINTWCRHRSRELWGEDVNIFNPNRDFSDRELWNNEVLSGYNPYSERFSPFTYPPRDCIGKNFAHMEARVILIYLFKNFTFELPEELVDYNWNEYYGINKGTMSPTNPLSRNKDGILNVGLELKPISRN